MFGRRLATRRWGVTSAASFCTQQVQNHWMCGKVRRRSAARPMPTRPDRTLSGKNVEQVPGLSLQQHSPQAMSSRRRTSRSLPRWDGVLASDAGKRWRAFSCDLATCGRGYRGCTSAGAVGTRHLSGWKRALARKRDDGALGLKDGGSSRSVGARGSKGTVPALCGNSCVATLPTR